MAEFRGQDRIKQVAAIGAGLIGSGWIAGFLARGYAVSVYDPAPDSDTKVRKHVAAAWPAMRALGLTDRAEPTSLTFHDTIASAVVGADFIQESLPERRDLKQAVYTELGNLAAPDVIIASSTSSLPITALQAACRHPERCVLGHPFNPVHLMPLVEVGPGEQTSPEVVDAAEALYTSMGKRPIRVRREIFGHIANRLTSAMFREAVSLVDQGYATVKDIDDAIRFGPALKWAIQGQFTTFHTSGGEGGLAHFLPHFTPGIMQRWKTMREPELDDPALQAKLVSQIRDAHPDTTVAEIAQNQDELLLLLLQVLTNATASGEQRP